MSEAAPIPELDFDTADRLRKALRFADVSVQEMAEHLGLSRNSVGRYINGHIEPDRRTLMLWALRCGVPLEWLQYGNERTTASGDYGPPSDFMLNADIPSGMSVDQTVPPTRAEILAHRKAFRLASATDPRFTRTAAVS